MLTHPESLQEEKGRFEVSSCLLMAVLRCLKSPVYLQALAVSFLVLMRVPTPLSPLVSRRGLLMQPHFQSNSPATAPAHTALDSTLCHRPCFASKRSKYSARYLGDKHNNNNNNHQKYNYPSVG